jgi:2-polyprenyl-6-methoxyphenol hydroxylase-like FAD-dependent oxidoreductase
MADAGYKAGKTDAPKPRTIVVGGGIGGCTTAIALAQAGADVTIYEQAPVLMEIGAGINCQAVAIGVLGRLGITEEMLSDPILGDGIQTTKIEYYTVDGVLIADEAVGRAKGDPFPQYSTHRAKFHNALIARAREVLGPEKVILDHVFTGMDKNDDGTITIHFERFAPPGQPSPGPQPDQTCDFLVGGDGLKSRVRASLLGEVYPRYTGRTIYRGLCELDANIGDGNTVVLCGNEDGNFIAYPISDGMRNAGKCHCNWGFNAKRDAPGPEDWTHLAKIEDIEEELGAMSQNRFGGYTPLDIAKKTQKIIGWALFDRDPLESFDFGNITLIGDSAHPLLPYGSQGATQAIMDSEALGVAYAAAMADGSGIRGAVKKYSDMRCEISGKVVIANRDMGSTAVLREVEKKCVDMSKDEKKKWIDEHGRGFFEEVIGSYRRSMPKSVSAMDAPTAK